MVTIDVHSTAEHLEAAGADPKLAAAIAEGIARATPRQSGPSSISILATATALGFTLLTVVFGWFMFEASQQRSDLRAAIEANRDRIDAVEVRLASDIADLSERMTRIETLLEERLPSRR
ncbi:MAG: hypothetical protein OXB98_23170 [Bryobacterales bacterium]|nr:hypothetical protein [Bryobacterales bacterium]